MALFSGTQTHNLKSIDSKKRVIEGVVSAQVPDLEDEITVQKYLFGALKAMLKRGVAPIAVSHSNRNVGQWKSFKQATVKDEEGADHPAIVGRGELFKDTKLATDIWGKIKDGTMRGLSFGGLVQKAPVMTQDGKALTVLKNDEVWEVSVCEQPIMPLARIYSMADAAKAFDVEFLSNKPVYETVKGEQRVVVQCDNNMCMLMDTDTKAEYELVAEVPEEVAPTIYSPIVEDALSRMKAELHEATVLNYAKMIRI